MFETTVLPVVERYAGKVFRGNDDQVALAIVLAWWVWSNRKSDFPASVYARCGVRQVMQGRDLPGLQTKSTDVWRKMDCWGGAGMAGMADPKPGPARRAEQKELFAKLLDDLNDRHREMADLLMNGAMSKDVADALSVSAGRISQMRAEAAERLASLE